MPGAATVVEGEQLWRFRAGEYLHCVTLRCDSNCAWCESCRSALPPGGWDRAPSGSPGDDARVILLHGGDALRHGDLQAWVRWARGNARAWIDVEGPADALGHDDVDAVVARVREAAPDGVSVVLPTVDGTRAARLTGRNWDPARVLGALRALSEDIAVRVIVPVNAVTVRELHDVIRAVDAALGARADLTLRRAIARRTSPRSLPLLSDGDGWEELDDLSGQLGSLPSPLPGGARLHMDPRRGYPPCMLSPAARRPELVRAREQGPSREGPLGELCGPCAWRAQCQWDPQAGAPSRGRVRPLGEDEARAMQSVSLDRDAAHTPHAPGVRRDREALGIPELLCVAPWTALSITQPTVHPVPCAISWVDNAVEDGDAAEVLGVSIDTVQSLAAQANARDVPLWYCLDNEEVTLETLWNNPLLRRMRRQMRGGGPSRHCRPMCRVIMGVEDRSIDLLARRDADLTPAVIENRRRLVEELREGRDVLRARPLDLNLGVASHCNITCGFCRGPGGTYGELTDRRREEVETWLPTLMCFTVSGPGEPLMSTNYLALLQRIARGDLPSLDVGLTTNGTLLTPSFLARHAQVRWSHVRISLNAGSAGTHERMTGKKLFDRVRRNLDALCALRDRSRPPFAVTLSCVLSELVMGDLHRFAELVVGYRTRVVVEPMYGDLDELSPWTRPARLAILADELEAVSRDFALRDPPLARAFEAVHRFARNRLAGDDFTPLRHR